MDKTQKDILDTISTLEEIQVELSSTMALIEKLVYTNLRCTNTKHMRFERIYSNLKRYRSEIYFHICELIDEWHKVQDRRLDER